jgi:hypothetical protein
MGIVDCELVAVASSRSIRPRSLWRVAPAASLETRCARHWTFRDISHFEEFSIRSRARYRDNLWGKLYSFKDAESDG